MKIMEFLAGKMRCEGKRVIPDTRKGIVRIARGDESLLHFQWIDRVTNVVEDDQIVFPDEAVFEKVNQASGRVYILKFSTDDRKFFFWMQEPSEAGDSQLCDSVNYCINQPLDHAEAESDASIPVKITEDMDDDDDDHDDNISLAAGSLASTSVGAEVSNPLNYSPCPVKLEDLERILNNIGSGIVEDKDHGIGLGDILKPDLIFPLVETLPLDQYLASYLPEGDWNSEELINLLQSPQVRQQIDFFTYVLQTGQIDLSQFGIDPSKYKFSVLSFLEALEDSVSSSTSEMDLRSQTPKPNEPMDEHQ